jgi:hypothetical protein
MVSDGWRATLKLNCGWSIARSTWLKAIWKSYNVGARVIGAEL